MEKFIVKKRGDYSHCWMLLDCSGLHWSRDRSNATEMTEGEALMAQAVLDIPVSVVAING